MALPQRVHPASLLPGAWRQQASQAWRFGELAGYITELSAQGASATLTFAMRMVWEAQCQGEPVAWVTSRAACFFPPDAVDNGVDLAALAVVRVPEPEGIGRAADYLVRSGAFGLVVLDFAAPTRLQDARPAETRPTEKQLTRLLGLARKHGTAILCLTAKPDSGSSLGSLVSLRASIARRRVAPGRFACDLHALKDKRRPPGWRHGEVFHGPPGLR